MAVCTFILLCRCLFNSNSLSFKARFTSLSEQEDEDDEVPWKSWRPPFAFLLTWRCPLGPVCCGRLKVYPDIYLQMDVYPQKTVGFKTNDLSCPEGRALSSQTQWHQRQTQQHLPRGGFVGVAGCKMSPGILDVPTVFRLQKNMACSIQTWVVERGAIIEPAS